MRNMLNRLGVPATVAIVLVVGGCIVSGTFIAVDKFSFTTQTGFYHYMVDITDNSDWNKRKNEIDDVDLVGFELWITNNETFEVTFNCYIDSVLPNVPAYDNYDAVDAGAFKIIEDLILPAGPGTLTHVTYGESFKYIRNPDIIKSLAKLGMFHYYGVSDGGTANGFIVDSGKVIVTFSAHGS